MQSYLCIGGDHDSLEWPAHADAETVTRPVGVTGKETYHRETLSVGDASITIYRHQDMTSEEVLSRLVGHYRAWCVNRPCGRR